jgi:hypothetical protein
MGSLTRRNFLKGTGLAAGSLAVSSLFGINLARAQNAADDDVQTILNLAATAELFAATHYFNAVNGEMGLGEQSIAYLKTGFVAEIDHFDFLVSLGAEPLYEAFYAPDGLYRDRQTFADLTEVAETNFVAAYMAANRIFAAAGETALAVTTAQLVASEAEHRALARQLAGRIPSNGPMAQFLFPNVSDVVPVLEPFLTGEAEGFVGPIRPLSADAVTALRAEAASLGYEPITPFVSM